MSTTFDQQAEAVANGEWHLPILGGGIDDRWLDAFICVRLQDVLARRYFETTFHKLSVEDRVLIRSEVESFITRQTWIQRKREVNGNQRRD